MVVGITFFGDFYLNKKVDINVKWGIFISDRNHNYNNQ